MVVLILAVNLLNSLAMMAVFNVVKICTCDVRKLAVTIIRVQLQFPMMISVPIG